MIRVLHSVSNMDRAGIETMIMNYYRHMDRQSVQFDFWANKPKVGAYEQEIEQMGGHVYRSPGYSPAKFPKYIAMMKRVFKADPDLKMIHVHNGALGLYALVAAMLCGKKVRIYHAHSSRIPPEKGEKLKKLMKPWIPLVATRLFTCGEKSARFYYGDRRFEKGECVMVRNAIEPDKFAFDPGVRAQMRAQHDLDGRIVIGHVGRLAVAKNHRRMLEIFAAVKQQLPNAVLVLLGEGELETQTREHAKELGLENDVRFMGNVGNVNQWYQALDLFLMPSIFEGLPVVAIEAQAAGLPCVLSDVITQEVKVTELTRFVSLDRSDTEWAGEIIAALDSVKERQDTRESIRAAGYDIAVEAPKLQALYESYAK